MWLKSKQVGWLELGAMDGVDGWMVGWLDSTFLPEEVPKTRGVR